MISNGGVTYDGTDVYYEGNLCAELSAIEIKLMMVNCEERHIRVGRPKV